MRQKEDSCSAPPSGNGFKDFILVPRERAYTLRKLVRGFTGPDPVTILNYTSATVANRLAEVLRADRFDTVQIEGVHLLNYIPAVRAHASFAAIIADWHNIESELMERYASTHGSVAHRLFAKRTAQLIQNGELRLLNSCDIHTVASEREREKLLARQPGAHIATIPNGVDVGYYSQSPLTQSGREVLFVGSMDYHANTDAVEWFAQNVWPLVRRSLHGATFTIVGRDPSPAIRAQAAADIIVTGTVADVRPYYARAAVVVAPLRIGSGTRLKILEAMAARVPVVSTRLGVEGLAVTDGADVLLADTPEQIAAAIGNALTSETRARLISGGYQLVVNNYDWAYLGSRLHHIHQTAVERRRKQEIR
jgi:glycosyltransferase involved in cell wall biosynthesis